MELLIYEVLIELDREMCMSRGALYRALVKLYTECNRLVQMPLN